MKLSRGAREEKGLIEKMTAHTHTLTLAHITHNGYTGG
jgi:hypothetical protein